MVQGEPDDVHVEATGGQWAVRIIENGSVRLELFQEKTAAEAYAENQRDRLSLPAKPPVSDTP